MSFSSPGSSIIQITSAVCSNVKIRGKNSIPLCRKTLPHSPCLSPPLPQVNLLFQSLTLQEVYRMESNTAFNRAVRASKRVRGISAPPEQPLEHTVRKTKNKNQGIQDIPAFRHPGGEAPQSPRSTQETRGRDQGTPGSRNDVEENAGQSPPPVTGNTSENLTSGEKKKKKNVWKNVLLTIHRFGQHRPGTQSRTTTDGFLGGCHEAVPR